MQASEVNSGETPGQEKGTKEVIQEFSATSSTGAPSLSWHPYSFVMMSRDKLWGREGTG